MTDKARLAFLQGREALLQVLDRAGHVGAIGLHQIALGDYGCERALVLRDLAREVEMANFT